MSEKITKLTTGLQGSVKTIDTLVGAVEAIVLAVVGRASSWVASVPCAVMTARASAEIFALSWPVAVMVAVALELVGQATSNGWLRAKEWNATKRKTDPAANVVLAFGLMIAYFAIDTLIVVALVLPKFFDTGDWRQLVAVLYPLVAVISTVVLNERVAQYKREADAQQERQDQSQKRKQKRESRRESARQPARQQVPTYEGIGADTRDRARAILAERPDTSGSDLGRMLDRSPSLGRKLKRELVPGGNGRDHDD